MFLYIHTPRSASARALWRPLGAALTLSTALALGGCGSSDNGVASKSAKEILRASTAAAEDSSSVHVVGKNSQGPISLSIDLHIAGNGGRGRVSFLDRKFELVRIGNTVYVKGGRPFYQALSRTLGKPVHVSPGAWLKGPSNTGPLSQFAGLTDLRAVLKRQLSAVGPITKAVHTMVNGQRAIQLKEKTRLYDGTLYVATAGKPYPIELIKSSGREQGKTAFSEWDEPVALTAPSPSVDISTLTH